MAQFIRNIREYLTLPGAVLGPLVFVVFVIVSIYVQFNISDAASYWTSAVIFVIGTLMSYNISRTAGFDGALSHFREVIMGSISIGLKSIKKLSDTPPEIIATQTKNSLEFIGIAGDKFLRNSMVTSEFFRKNKDRDKVRLILMDPFSDDIVRLSIKKNQQIEYRNKIISTIVDLDKMRSEGFNFSVRLYPKVPPLRLMISDSAITTLSVYTLDTNGWKNAQLIFDTKDCPDSLAPHFFDLFDDLWERGLGFNLTLRAAALKGLLSIDSQQDTVELGMVHGRFQPFHHEHLEYVLHGITHSKKCLIGITQPDIKAISECEILPHRGKPEGNPYSFQKRKDMIRISLDDLGIDPKSYEIISFDIDHPDTSFPALVNSCNGRKAVHFLKVFSDWELYKKQKFEEFGFEVKVIRVDANEYSIKNVTGTLVRELILSKRNWQDFVPVGTKKVLSIQPDERGFR